MCSCVCLYACNNAYVRAGLSFHALAGMMFTLYIEISPIDKTWCISGIQALGLVNFCVIWATLN